MSSQISRHANQMSIRTGISICNHGMVPVHHPTGGGRSQSIFFRQRSAPVPVVQPQMDGLMKAGFITGLVFKGLDTVMNLIGNILNWCGFGQPPVQEEPKKEIEKDKPKKEIEKDKPKKEIEKDKPKKEIHDVEGGGDKYGIDGQTTKTRTVKTVPFGGPYHYTKVYLVDGKPVKYGTPEYRALVDKLNHGAMMETGTRSQRVLAEEVDLGNGKKAVLMPEAEATRILEGLRGEKGTTDARYVTYSENGQYYIYKKNPADPNDRSQRVGTQTFESEQAAKDWATGEGYTLE